MHPFYSKASFGSPRDNGISLRLRLPTPDRCSGVESNYAGVNTRTCTAPVHTTTLEPERRTAVSTTRRTQLDFTTNRRVKQRGCRQMEQGERGALFYRADKNARAGRVLVLFLMGPTTSSNVAHLSYILRYPRPPIFCRVGYATKTKSVRNCRPSRSFSSPPHQRFGTTVKRP